MESHVIVADPPRKLVIAWRDTGNVTFLLEPYGEAVLLTLMHAGFRHALSSSDTLPAGMPTSTCSKRWLSSASRSVILGSLGEVSAQIITRA